MVPSSIPSAAYSIECKARALNGPNKKPEKKFKKKGPSQEPSSADSRRGSTGGCNCWGCEGWQSRKRPVETRTTALEVFLARVRTGACSPTPAKRAHCSWAPGAEVWGTRNFPAALQQLWHWIHSLQLSAPNSQLSAHQVWNIHLEARQIFRARVSNTQPVLNHIQSRHNGAQ